MVMLVKKNILRLERQLVHSAEDSFVLEILELFSLNTFTDGYFTATILTKTKNKKTHRLM